MLENKLIMTELLGNWDSLFPLEPFGSNVSLRITDSSTVKICILIAHYYPSLHWDFVKSTPYVTSLHTLESKTWPLWVVGMLKITLSNFTMCHCFQLMVGTIQYVGIVVIFRLQVNCIYFKWSYIVKYFMQGYGSKVKASICISLYRQWFKWQGVA